MTDRTEATFWRLAEAHRDRLLKFALSKRLPLDVAEDIVQETLLKALRYWDCQRSMSEETFPKFLLRIEFQLIALHHRLKKTRNGKGPVRLVALNESYEVEPVGQLLARRESDAEEEENAASLARIRLKIEAAISAEPYCRHW